MTVKQENPGLLGVLQKLYSKVSLAVLRKRMDSYNKEASSIIGAGHDISSSLAGHINKLATSEDAKCKGVACEDVAQIVPKDTASEPAPHAAGNSSEQRPTASETSLVSTVLDGLARYFKNGQSEPSIQPHVSDKLKKSTLDHIHTTLRLARQGDVTTAKLHADIANQALKELAHYMPQDEYKTFAAEVETLLEEFKDHKH